LEHTPFLYGQQSPADRARELFESALNRERLVIETEENNFHRAISAFLAMFTKPQDVLTGLSKQSMTSMSRGNSEIKVNHWHETVRDLNAF